MVNFGYVYDQSMSSLLDAYLVGVVAVSLIAGCGSDSPRIGSNGRVTGHVLAGPTCPVEQSSDTKCQPKAVQGSVQFEQDGDVVGTIDIKIDGAFATEIPAGSYTVTVDVGDNIFPVCSPVEVEVQANADAVVEISCDTGIR
jgi:hypothetical protein